MPTIAENLVELKSIKDRLVSNLEVDGKDPAGKNFSELVDLPFDDIYEYDDGIYSVPGFPIDLATWVEDGAVGFIFHNSYLGVCSFSATTTAGNYRLIVHDGTNEVSNQVYGSTVQSDVNFGVGDGTVYYAVKIVPENLTNKITTFRILKHPSVTMTAYQIGMVCAYVNTDSLTSGYSLFNHAGVTKSPDCKKIYIKSTKNITSMTYMFYDCRGLRLISSPDFDTSKVTHFTYTFYSCNSIRTVPETITTNIATGLSGMFSQCYELRKIPDLVIREDIQVDISSMFNNCYKLKRVMSRFNTSKSTVFENLFNYCYSLEEIPEAFSTENATNISSLFAACYSLRSTPPLITPKVTSANYVFAACPKLETPPVLSDYSKVTNLSDFSSITYSVKQPYTIDLSTAPTHLARVAIPTASKLGGLIVNPNGTWPGVSPQIDLANSDISKDALVALFNSLGVVTGKTIRISGTKGNAELSAADIAIATTKGWTVTR